MIEDVSAVTAQPTQSADVTTATASTTSTSTDTDNATLVAAFQDAIVQLGILMMSPLVTDAASEANNE